MSQSRKKPPTANPPELTRIAQFLAVEAAGERLRCDDARRKRDERYCAKFVRPAEVAGIVNKSFRTVQRWIRAGIIPSVKIGGSRLIAVEDLERLFLGDSRDQDKFDDPSK